MIIVIIVDIGVKGIVRCMKGGMEFMTEKRFNRVGGYVYDEDKCISHFEDVKHRDEIIDLLNALYDENEKLRKDLIDHSALISMLEDYQALKIEDTLWNLTGAKSEEEFNELYKPYLEKAKKCWKGDV